MRRKKKSILSSGLGLAYWMDADLIALEQTAQSLLNIPKEHLQTGTVSYGLYFLGIFHYHRNEQQSAEDDLAQVFKNHYADSPMNFAQSAFALALTHQAQGKPCHAREICQAVAHDFIETNNTDMLRIARSFEAELALRQGHLASAFQWLEKYDAKPFFPPFGFYMPQLTAVKALLVQNTADSRSQAADLLDRLHDYLESIHNNRFRIDVLALQALLRDARGENSEAVEKLSQALALAEPGGFIRLFVDLGPPMAHLLKRLIEKNVAVKYAGRILAAFREDAHHTISPSPGLSSVAPKAKRDLPASQPLAEPLSNRELEILDLLAQRLRNKEICEEKGRQFQTTC